MKIASTSVDYIVEIISNRVWGGGEKYALDLSETLLEHGHSLIVATRGIESVDSRFRQSGVPVVKLRFGGITDIGSMRKLAGLIAKSIQSSSDVKEGVVFHVHNFKDMYLAIGARRILRRKGIASRIIVTRHLVRPAKSDLHHRWLYGQADRIVFVSQTAEEAFFSGLRKSECTCKRIRSKSIVIPNSIKGISPVETRRDDHSPLRLIYSGRIAEEKGISLLLESLKGLSESGWHLMVLGTGEESYLQELKAKAHDYGIEGKITWVGYTTETMEYIKDSDIGIFPSTVSESFGLTLLEFMNGRLAIVSTDTGAQKELITHESNGLLCKADIESLREALQRMITDEALRHRLADKAIETARKYSYEEFYNKTEKLF